MIGLLRGNVAFLDSSSAIIDVSGVGYTVLLPASILAKLHKDEQITVYTYTHVREDLLELYGFTDRGDLQLFKMLIGVSGVGCKTALHIFSLGKRADIVHAIHKADLAFFTGVPRLGKKNAQKIIIELKGKLGGNGDLDLSSEAIDTQEVIEALKVFGYSLKEAQDAYRQVSSEEISTEEKIRLALKYLGK